MTTFVPKKKTKSEKEKKKGKAQFSQPLFKKVIKKVDETASRPSYLFYISEMVESGWRTEHLTVFTSSDEKRKSVFC
jgi:hypothetical protein